MEKFQILQNTKYLGISSEEAIGQGHPNVKPYRLEESPLHLQELRPSVGVVTNVQEILNKRRTSLLPT